MIYTDEQFDEQEQKEYSLTEESIAILLLTLGVTHTELEKELRNFYQKYGKNGVVTYQAVRKWVSDTDHRKRMTMLFSFVGDNFDASFDTLKKQFRDHLTDIILSEIEFFGLSEGVLDIDKILSLSWGADELNWETRLLAYQEKWATVVCNDLKLSFLQRKNIAEVLVDLDKRFVSMEKILWRLYVTESTAVGSLARREIFKELGIKKYRFYAREDERTCEHCGSLHGLIFPITAYEVGVTASPIHSHCRCWEVPIRE